ncbi:MAG: hypothetical protein ABI865_11605, partial [Nitrosospira sp.]
KWLDAGGIFSALSIGMIALAASTLSGAILTATGGQKTVIYSQSACLMLMIGGLYLSINFSLVYVGITVTIAYTARLIMQLKAISLRGGIAPIEFLSAIRGPLLIAFLMAAPVTLFFDYHLGMVPTESLALALKCVTLLLLVKMFPSFFICSALVNILVRFATGRRLVATLRL